MNQLTQGVFYVATGEKHRRLTVRAVESLRRTNPTISVSIFTDEPEAFVAIRSRLDQVFRISEPSGSFHDKIFGFINAPYDRCVFLDSDTTVVGDIQELFDILEQFDFAAAHAPGHSGARLHDYESKEIPSSFVQFDTGVVCFRRASAVAEMFHDWQNFYRENPCHHHDQPGLRAALYKSGLRIYTQPPDYNLLTGIARLSGSVKIIHSAAAEAQIRAREQTLTASTGARVVLPNGKIEYLSPPKAAPMSAMPTPLPIQAGEFHLFILWEAARGCEARILGDLKKSFDLVAVREVRWSAARVSDNFTRFYGQKLPPGSFKEEHCGKGPFLVVLVRDRAPRYEKRQTSKGERSVNPNTFDAKQRYRKWTGGGHRVHATDSESETRHDFALLFGTSLAGFAAAHPGLWDGKNESWNSDLAGAEGWADLGQFFTILNETVRYLVLRNFEWLPDRFRTAEHGDIDLLTDSAGELAFVANARKVFPEPYRIHYAVKIAGEEVLFDFRHAGDDYYDTKWENFMLAERQWNERGFYIMPAEDYFYSLLYHALVHKPKVAADYVEKLTRLAADLKLPGVSAATFARLRLAKRLLDVFLQLQGYAYRCPADLSVHFNGSLLRAVPAVVIQPEAVRGLPALRHSATLLSSRFLAEEAGIRYFSVVHEDAETGGILKQTTGDLAWRDAELLRRLDGPHFPRVLDARKEANYSVAVFECICGRELSQAIPEIAATPKSLATFFSECLDIVKALQSAKITHRDIQTHNLMVRDGHPVLIDFGWAIAPNAPCFDPDGLGDSGRPADGSFCDVFAMGKVFAACAPVNHRVFAPLIAAMTAVELPQRMTSVVALQKMLDELNLPSEWASFPAFASKRRHVDSLPWQGEVPVILERANAFMVRCDLASAGSYLETGLLNHPASSELHALSGMILMQQGKTDAAVGHFTDACRHDPTNLAAGRFLASVLIDLGRFHEAVDALKQLLKMNPNDPVVLGALAGCLAQVKDVRLAAPACQPVMASEPAKMISPTTANGRLAPKVSIIIPVLNKVGFTRKCLKALKQNTSAGLYEVIVWDNGSTDETRAFLEPLAAADKSIRYFRSEENLGFVGGNNAAVQHAGGEFLVFLNNDTEPQPGWLEALVQTVEADIAIGAVGAKLIYPNGKLQEAGGIVFRDASGWNYGRTQDPRDPRFNFLREVDYCSAACLLVRTALFRELGGFDVRYAPAYYEDTDLCFALRQLGHRVVYQPRCEIIHHEGATAGQDLAKGFKQYQVANRQKFFEKWRAALARQSAPDAAAVRRAGQRVRGQRVLVIDPLLPMYDRASGSKRLFEMLKLLVVGGHAVTFIARNGQGGERYAAELQQLGIEVYAGDAERMKECGFTVKCWPLDLKKLLQEVQYDLVILSFWYIAEQYLPRIRDWSPTSQVVIDTVDVHYVRERRQAELYRDAGLLQQAEATCQRELSIYCRADALITVTEDDRQTLLQAMPQSRIFVVPNIHDVASNIPPLAGRSGCLFVGGFAHPPNTDAVLYFHREIWPRIRQRLPDARWTIVGNNPPRAVLALAGPAITVTGYVPSMEPYLRSHLVSVAPLRYGAGMKGKIGEALANGLPVVTTTIGAEGMGLQHGTGGALVADDPEAFADHVARLHADHDYWNQLSAQGLQHIETHFTPQCIARQLNTMLDWSGSFCSIIVLALNQRAHTEKCLASIAAHTPSAHEVIVVDNGSTDDTAEFLSAWQAKHDNCTVIRNESNRGFAGGNNQGLAVARGKYLLFLNNDTVVTAGWLEAMLAVYARHPETGLVGPVSNRVSGPQWIQEAAYQNLSELPEFAARHVQANAGQSFEVIRAVGFCLLATRDVIAKVGGLDENFGSGNFEDDDFCLRTQFAGFRIRVARDSFVHHTGSQTFAGEKIDYRLSMQRNWELFRTKWALPAEATLESGYPIPRQLPKNLALHIPLPPLAATHVQNGRSWTEKKKISLVPVAIKPAPVASRGRLDEARELFAQKSFPAAWNAALTAIAQRPFHPEAILLLAEIARAAGDGPSAKLCALRARSFAPGWNPTKQFLKHPLKGNTKLDWLDASRFTPHAARLSVCLIVKNEEQFLAQCLNSVRGLASQIIVVDTGSTDRTVEIAREFGAEIYAFKWNDDFAAARNAALEHATGDWVLILDADEELPAAQHDRLRADMKQADAIAFRLPLVNRGQEAEGRSFVPRLIRNAPGNFYFGRIHEQIFSSLLPKCKAWGLKTALGSAEILHHGYTKEMVRDRNKIERNLKLLPQAIAENPADVNLVMNLGLELVRSGDLAGGVTKYRDAFELMSAQPAGEVVAELREVLLTQFTSQLYKIRAHAEAVQVLNSPLAKKGGLTASLHFALGLAHFELKDYRAAADQMRQCLAKRKQPALSPINTDIRTAAPNHCLALSLAKLGEVDAAEKAFQAALGEPGRLDDIKLDRTKFLLQQNRAVDALNALHEMVAANPGQPAAWRLGGEIALSRPEFLEFARDWTGEAMKSQAEDLTITAQHAEALLLSGDTAAAGDLWERVWNSDRQPKSLAALILCEAVEAPTTHAPDEGPEELATSRAFIAWYQKLIASRAQTVIGKVNEAADKLSRALPTAAKLLEAALAETEACDTV